MKNYLIPAFLTVLLVGCGEHKGGDWSSDCETYHSVTGRELSECKAKVAAHRQLEIEPGISIDAGNMNREGFGELGKGGSRHASEINPSEK